MSLDRKSTLSFGILMLFSFGFLSTASAANCELRNGQTLSGEYIQRSLVGSSPPGVNDGGSILKFEQTGCKLVVSSTSISSYYQYNTKTGKISTKPVQHKGAIWVLDLSGEIPAIVPKQFIQDNSHDAESSAMTKSLQFFTKLNTETGAIETRLEFDLAHAGVSVRMQVSGEIGFSYGNYGVETPSEDAYSKESNFSGIMAMNYPGLTFQVIPDARLEAEQGAKNLAIRTSANWFLDFAKPFINYALKVPGTNFMKR